MTAFVNDVEATTNGAAVTVKANVHRALKVSPDGQHSTDGFGKVMGSCSFALRCGQRIVKLSGNKGGVEHQTVPNSYMIRRETYTAIDVPSGAYEVIVVANSGALRNTMIDTNVQVAVHRPLGPVSAIVRIGDASHLFEEGDSVDEVTLPLTYANDCKLQLLGSDNKVLQSAQAQRLKVARVEVELRKAGTGGDVEQHSVAQPLQSFGVDLLMHVDDESQQQLLALPPLSAPFDGGADAQQPTPPPIAGSHQQPPPPTSARSAQQSTSALFGGGADAHQPHGAGAEQLFDFDRLFAPTSVPLFDFDWPVEQHLVPQGADGAPVDGSRSPLAQAPSVMQVDSDVQQQAAPGGGAVCSLPPPPTSACALDSLAGDAPRSAQQSTSALPPSVMQVDSDVQQQAAPGGGAVGSLPVPPTSAGDAPVPLGSLAGGGAAAAASSTTIAVVPQQCGSVIATAIVTCQSDSVGANAIVQLNSKSLIAAMAHLASHCQHSDEWMQLSVKVTLTLNDNSTATAYSPLDSMRFKQLHIGNEFKLDGKGKDEIKITSLRAKNEHKKRPGPVSTFSAPFTVDSMCDPTAKAIIQRMHEKNNACGAALRRDLNTALATSGGDIRGARTAVDNVLNGYFGAATPLYDIRLTRDELPGVKVTVDHCNNSQTYTRTAVITVLCNTARSGVKAATTRFALTMCDKHNLPKGKGAWHKVTRDVVHWVLDSGDHDDGDAAAADDDADDDADDADVRVDAQVAQPAEEVVSNIKGALTPLLAAVAWNNKPIKRATLKNAVNGDMLLADMIALAHAVSQLAHNAATGKHKSKPPVCAVPRDMRGAGSVGSIIVDKSAFGMQRESDKSLYDALCQGWGAQAVNQFLAGFARNSRSHARTLGSTFTTDGHEVLVHFANPSRRRITSSYVIALVQIAADKFVNAALDYPLKPRPKAKARPDNFGLSREIAEAVRDNKVDFFKAADAHALDGAVRAELRGKAFYERCVDAGMMRGGMTPAALKTLLTRFMVGIDTGVADLASIRACAWRECGDTEQWSTTRIMQRADYHLRAVLELAADEPLDDGAELSPANAAAVLAKFEWVSRADRVRGRGTDYSSRGAQRMSTAAAEAAAARRATGVRDGATQVPLLANALQAAHDGEPAKLRRLNKRFLAKAAESPVRAVRRVLDVLGASAVTDRQIRDRIVIVVGNPTFGPTYRGYRASPAKKLVLELARRFQTFVVNEYMTSQRCAECGAPTAQTRDGVVRYRHCTATHPHPPAQGDNKDFTAALSMLRIALNLWIYGERPLPWKKETAAAAAAAAAARSTTTTTKKKATKRSASNDNRQHQDRKQRHNARKDDGDH